VQNLSEINQDIRYLSNPKTESTEKSSDSFDYNRVSTNYEIIVKRISIAKQALNAAEQGLKFVDVGDTFYNDYILLPVQFLIY